MTQQPNDLSKPKTPQEYLRLLLTGMAMGAADIVPGVSGGTMAFILGVYESLIEGIKSFNLDALRLLIGRKFQELVDHTSLRFLIALGIGIVLSVVLLSGFLSNALDDPTSRVYVFAFFFGLVVASIIAVGAKVKWGSAQIVILIVAALVALVIVNVVPAEAPHEPLNLIVSGMIAICAMILPGISGAFILLILGQYDYVLTAVSDRNIPPVLFVLIGAVIGILAFSRVLSWLLKNYYHSTVTALVGFMVGSLWKIYPWKDCILQDVDRHGDARCLQEMNILPQGDTVVLAIILAIVGFIIVTVLDHIQSKDNPILRPVWK